MAAWLAGFLVVAVGAEIAVRAGRSRLDEPLDYFSKPAQVTVRDMDVLRRAGVRSDLTFVGTSMVRRDVDANRLEAGSPQGGVTLPDVRYANNVAVPGAQTTLVRRWLLEEVVPRLRPRRVVWGISSLDFNAGRPDFPIDLYDAARATDEGVYGALDRAMARVALSRYRSQLRDPYVFAREVTGTPRRFNEPRPLVERATWKLGYAKRTPKQLARERRAHAVTVRDRQLRNFRVGPDELAAFRTTLAALRRQGIDVAVVLMPVTKGYISFHPRGAADFLAWKRLVTATARAQQVPVLDLTRAVDDNGWQNFRDYEHLWPPAARTFTDLLATRLAALGW